MENSNSIGTWGSKRLHRALLLSTIMMMCQIHTMRCCTHLRVASENPELQFLIGDYVLDPTIIGDGRPVFVQASSDPENENEDQKKIYHHSFNPYDEDTDSNEDAIETEFHGRWILGENIYSDNGWAYIPSWSIDPSDTIMQSYVTTSKFIHDELNDEQVDLLNEKLKWQIYYDDDWQLQESDEDFSVECLSLYSDYHKNWDFLFVTTQSLFSFDSSICNINHRTIHGFYYRIDSNIWRKIESSFFLVREATFFNSYNLTSNLNSKINSTYNQSLQNNGTVAHDVNQLNVNQSLLQQLLSLYDIKPTENLDNIVVYSIVEYNEYTDENGLPIQELINNVPFRLTTMFVKNNNKSEMFSMNTLSDKKWHILDMSILTSFNHTQDIFEMMLYSSRVDMTLLHAEDKDNQSTIYDVFRNYYKQLKLDSFLSSISTTLHSSVYSSNELKDKLINTANNNDDFPYMMVGLGTGGLANYTDNREVILQAFSIGYRKFDSAAIYHSEEALGDLILENKIVRDDVFVTSKLWPTDHGYVETFQSVLNSLDNLRTNYIDSYLIHWPHCIDEFEWMDCSEASHKDYIQTWEMMQKLYSEGVLLSIGVSNFDFEQFNRLILSANSQILPHVVQNYFDIANQDWHLVEYVNAYGVVFEGYATYRGIAESEERKDSEPHYQEWFDHLNQISQSKRINSTDLKTSTPSQVLLRWLSESKISIIPRSRNLKHLQDNWNLWDFQLSQNDIELITTRIVEQIEEKTEL